MQGRTFKIMRRRIALRLRQLHVPPMKGAALALVIGLVLPFVLAADREPAELRMSLVRDRLANFEPQSIPSGPSGTILHARPAFSWQGVNGATAYRFELTEEGGAEYVQGYVTTELRYLLEPPARLERGHRYTMLVQPLDEAGATIGRPIEETFSVARLDDALAETLLRAQRIKDPGRRAITLAGIYADQGSPHDVASALEFYLRAAPEGEEAALAMDLLASLGRR